MDEKSNNEDKKTETIDEELKELSESLSWEERTNIYADTIYNKYKAQVTRERGKLTDIELAMSIMALAMVIGEGQELLLREEEQSAHMALGFLSGYLMGRTHE